MNLRKIWIFLLSLCFLFLMAAGYYFWFCRTIHPVIEGQVYRSAQLSPYLLAKNIEKYHIKTVLNLRSDFDSHSPWHNKEKEITRLLGVVYVDLPLYATQLPTSFQLSELIRILESAPKPLLLHCLGGADRSGLASEIALIVLKDEIIEKAAKQASWHYFVLSSMSVGRLIREYYSQWLSLNHLQPSRVTFLRWVSEYSEEKATHR